MLKDSEIKEIKRQHAEGVSQKILAVRFGVTEQAIGQVLVGKIGSNGYRTCREARGIACGRSRSCEPG